jgi:hypothetical protein
LFSLTQTRSQIYATLWQSFVQIVAYSATSPQDDLRASPAVLSVCDPAKMFFTSKFSYVLFCNPINQ